MTLDEIIDQTLRHEGGFVNDPHDRGGATNYGITKAVYERWIGHPVTVDDMKTMPIEHAREIYRKQYFLDCGYDHLPEEIQDVMFDMAVNHGPVGAGKLLQRTVNTIVEKDIAVDGLVGEGTRKAVDDAMQMVGGMQFRNRLVDERIGFFNRIVAKDPSQVKFLRGWLRRAESFRI